MDSKNCIMVVSYPGEVSTLIWFISVIVLGSSIGLAVLGYSFLCLLTGCFLVISLYYLSQQVLKPTYCITCIDGLGFLLSKQLLFYHTSTFIPHQVVSQLCLYEQISMITIRYLIGLEIKSKKGKFLLPVFKDYCQLSYSQLIAIYYKMKACIME